MTIHSHTKTNINHKICININLKTNNNKLNILITKINHCSRPKSENKIFFYLKQINNFKLNKLVNNNFIHYLNNFIIYNAVSFLFNDERNILHIIPYNMRKNFLAFFQPTTIYVEPIHVYTQNSPTTINITIVYLDCNRRILTRPF